MAWCFCAPTTRATSPAKCSSSTVACACRPGPKGRKAVDNEAPWRAKIKGSLKLKRLARRRQPIAGSSSSWARPGVHSRGGSYVSSSIEERVINIVCEQMGASRDKIQAETSFINDLGADSLDTVELVMEFEDEFDINIPDEDAEKIQTVGDAIEYIKSRVQ